jgi:hypothetical protein
MSRQFTIQGLQFSTAAKYAEGHALTAAEAAALNQTRIENLRNNFASEIKAKIEEAGVETGDQLSQEIQDELQASFETFAAEYEFSERKAGSPRQAMDPVAREANRIATQMLLEHLKAKNIKRADLDEGVFDGWVKQVLDKKPEITAEAKRRVEEASKVAKDSLAELDLA